LTASLKKMVMPKVKAVRHVTKAPGKRLVRARATGKDVVTWATPAFDVEPSTSE
jgi:hypothetical protein